MACRLFLIAFIIAATQTSGRLLENEQDLARRYGKPIKVESAANAKLLTFTNSACTIAVELGGADALFQGRSVAGISIRENIALHSGEFSEQSQREFLNANGGSLQDAQGSTACPRRTSVCRINE